MFITKEQMKYFRELCTNARGVFDERKFRWMIEDYSAEQEIFEDVPCRKSSEDVSPIKYERKSLQDERKIAVAYYLKNFSREERILEFCAEDSKKYISCFTSDKFKSEDARQMIVGEFRQMFSFLREKMAEFGWDKKFLAANGIDFPLLRKLFFQVAAN